MSLSALGLSTIVQQGKPPSYGLPVLAKAVEQAFDKRPRTGALVLDDRSTWAMAAILGSTLGGAIFGGYLSYKRCPKIVCVVMGTSFGATLGGVGSTLMVRSILKETQK
jgi:hypothetical protein